MSQISAGDLTRMQNDAMRRVYEMQRQAQGTFEKKQGTALERALDFDEPQKPAEQPLLQDDPILKAALAYLLG